MEGGMGKEGKVRELKGNEGSEAGRKAKVR